VKDPFFFVILNVVKDLFFICHPERSEGSVFSFVILNVVKDLFFFVILNVVKDLFLFVILNVVKDLFLFVILNVVKDLSFQRFAPRHISCNLLRTTDSPH